MTASLVRVEGEFVVARPIPFDEDDTMRAHIDRVVDSLTSAESVVEVDTEAELDEGQVRLAIVFADTDEQTADQRGRETMAASIRRCEGRHFQLLGEAEEAKLALSLPSRGGLLSPMWRLRRLAITPIEGA